tara:strand:+ start:8580 stop:8849 length:270 start_codon:yes stop_codon:yes gene_type:complete
MQNAIIVQNLKCGGCVKNITSRIGEIASINQVVVDLATAAVSFTSESAEGVLKVKETLKTLGYPPIDDSNNLISKAKSFVSCAMGKISS